jgi:hypothetical protein
MRDQGLRVVLYDRTCRGLPALPGLSHAWAVGAALYEGAGHIDARFGAASWAEALAWLAQVESTAPLREIQFWGHGRPGAALVAGERLGIEALSPGHPRHEALARVRARFAPGGTGLWWFRTCETFAGPAGARLARAWAQFFGCRTAGHTRVIGVRQPGLEVIAPGDEAPVAAGGVTCFRTRLPRG